MYSRKIDDDILTFGHEGILYRESFVMYDRGTESLWIHTTGECVKGKLKGKQLKFIQSVVTPWSDWKARHPATTVLEGTKVRGFMGTYTLNRDKNKFGISVGEGEESNLYPFSELGKEPVIHDKLGDKDIVVFFNSSGEFATAWDNDDGHKFRWDAKQKAFVDQTGKRWDMMLGVRAGDKDSPNMIPIPATAWLIHRWKGFYPKSRIYESTKNQPTKKK